MSMSTEMLSQPPPSSVADVEPGRIKVFGIIHIIFGGLGLVGSAFGVVALLVLNPVLSWLEEMIRQEIPPGDVTGPEVVAMLESFGAMRTLESAPTPSPCSSSPTMCRVTVGESVLRPMRSPACEITESATVVALLKRASV
jgi:hypothetical protein